MNPINLATATGNDEPLYWVVSRSPGRRQLPADFPIIVDEKTRIVCEPAFLFLYERYVKGKVDKPVTNTLGAYADDLKEWFRYCEEFSFSWTEATVDDVTSFIRIMRATYAPQTGRLYATNTINRRKSTIFQFYTWARNQKICREQPQTNSLLDPNIDFEETVNSIRNSLPPRADEDNYVTALQPQEVYELFQALGPLPSELMKKTHESGLTGESASCNDIEPALSSRDRLANEIALGTGLRISEVCNLPFSKFKQLKVSLPDTECIPINIIGKGNKKRMVHFSGLLIKEIQIYIKNERRIILESCSSTTNPTTLLINPISAKKAAGKPVNERTLERVFSSACIKVGLVKFQAVNNFDIDGKVTSQSIVQVPRYVFHSLRHTYAIWTYYARKLKDDEPWFYIQARLGHSSLETTINTYLKIASDFEAKVSDNFMVAAK
jgi:site-specific recombinase XerD